MRLLDDLAGPPGRMLTLLAPQALRRYPDCTEASGGTLSGTLLVDTDEAGNGMFNPTAMRCDGGVCDKMQTVCYLSDPVLFRAHGRRSMSYVDADGRKLLPFK